MMWSPRIRILLLCACFAHRCLAALPKNSECSSEGVVIKSARGFVTSPGFPGKYSAHHDCKWNIVAPKGTGLKLHIEHLDNKEMYDGGVGQCFDKLRILSGAPGDLSYIDNDELCAKDVTELRRSVFEVPTNDLESVVAQIQFTSDYADHNTGFSIFYEIVCNSSQAGVSGRFSSPNYPDEYPNNADCFTQIHAPDGNAIEVSFSNVNVENQATCTTDYIAVTKGTAGIPIGPTKRYCKSDVGTIQIDSNIATIKFVSDANIMHPGFEATWRAVSPTTVPPTTTALVVETSTAEMKNCSYTNESILCQRWDTSMPHKPKYTPADKNHNFCRNPDNDDRGPWCYTTDPKKRWGYCDLDNCVSPPTTESPTTTQATPSDSGTSASSQTVGAVFNGVTAQKQVSDSESSGSYIFAYVLIPVAILLLLLLALIFVWRRRRRKGAAAVSDPAAEDMVRFNQLERDGNDEEPRPRENTYVEIPVGGVGGRGRGKPPSKSANGFVGLGKGGSRQSSTSSQNSIQLAKDEAKRSFVPVNSITDQPSTSGQTYSAADDPEAGAVGGRNPYNMADDVIKTPEGENVYHTIGIGQETGKDHQSSSENVTPPPPVARNSSKDKLSKKGSGKKKEKVKKESSKKKKRSVPKLGFGNPSYQDADPAKEEESATENPFDTDDDTKAGGATAVPRTASIPIMGRSQLHDHYKPHRASEGDNTVRTDNTGGMESPYMAPKLPLPNKSHMVPISPDAIDEKEGVSVFGEDASVYSTPKPMQSPQFDLSGNFIYDAPREFSAGKEGSDSGVSRSEDPRKERSGSANTGRDSGNSSLSAIDSVEEEENREEYCTMNSVPRAKKKPAQKEIGKDNADNRLSHLYMSMKETPDETSVAPKKFYENESQQATKI